MRDRGAKPAGSRAKASKKKRGDRKVDSAINAWGLLAPGLKATGRNRRVTATLSPILSLCLAPSGKLYQKVQQLLSENDEKASASNPPVIDEQRHPGPKKPRYGIPAEEWQNIRRRVLENRESLRQVAEDYGVSYETVRRFILATHKQAN
jgi:hypothetical protein